MNHDKYPKYVIRNQFLTDDYTKLNQKKASRFLKRIFDIFFSLILLLIFLPIIILISCVIFFFEGKPIIYKQIRVTRYEKRFIILKFRTMENHNSKLSITLNDDERITKLGKFLRKFRLDEIPQLINILFGEMSFVGTRPEVPEYVDKYTDEMRVTMLMRAGLTSTASYTFRNEQLLYDKNEGINPQKIYLDIILPQKMKYNIEDLRKFSFINDIKVLIITIYYVFFKKEV